MKFDPYEKGGRTSFSHAEVGGGGGGPQKVLGYFCMRCAFQVLAY